MNKRKAKSSDQRSSIPLRKKQFIVGDQETITQCLERMKREGYTPIRRTEKPIFRETPSGPECFGSQCVLEGKYIPKKGEQ
ncbi:NETI motif-containing protein [Sporolactobacillus nakayamae]|uniref:NETI motif-containing protein n=1 Tax=Sporolactobacillus nakayamae TaxID=269670 RepID=UPI001FDFEA63|nr:NETI motif-containing protein [Sporolactobacillus nakayamae]